MRATLPGRFRPYGEGGGLPRGFDRTEIGRWTPGARPRSGFGALMLPPRRASAGLALVLAAFAAFVVSRVGGVERASATDRPGAGQVSFDGVGYALVGVSVTRRIPQRGGRAIDASGVFEIVKLRLRAADGRRHLVSSDLLTLLAGGTYYGVSRPDDIGLNDPQWGAVTAATAVPANGTLTVKAVFDVAPAALGHPAGLHVGTTAYIDRAPAQTLRLPGPAGCCAAPRHGPPAPPPAPLMDDPVIG